MSSLLNSVYTTINPGDTNVGAWENVKQYTSVRLFFNLSGAAADLELQWANNPSQPSAATSAFVTTSMSLLCVSGVTISEVPHYGSWYRTVIKSLETQYPIQPMFESIHQLAPTGIHFEDASNNIADVKHNTLCTVLTDGYGKLIKNTSSAMRAFDLPALYTTLTDCSGAALGTLSGALCVEPSLSILSDIVDTNKNYLLVSKKDASGNQIATTTYSTDRNRVIPYISLETHSTAYTTPNVDDNKNAMYAHLVDAQGVSIGPSNPLYVQSVGSIKNYTCFDSTSGGGNGLTTTPIEVTSSKVNLQLLMCYNGGPTTCWVRLRNHTDNKIILNIGVPAGETHDVVFINGCTFAHGLKLSASTAQDYNVNAEPSPGEVAVSLVYVAST